ncbi:MAG: response regulator transcription factor [Velocimicrobium sp.]
MKKILIVEDDLKLNNGIRLALKGQEYMCYQSDSISSANETFRKEKVDLILLDINLPDGCGLDWLVNIRKKSTVPIILISANNMEMDIVSGLELGANDYITKPFSLMVLRARIGVQLREIENESTQIIQMDDFYFDFKKIEFRVSGKPIELSRTEQKLLRKLVDNPGITLNRSMLTDEIWSGDSEYVDEHALTVVIKRLRDKLEDSQNKRPYIKTVYGIGYAWDNDNGSSQT